MIHEFELTARYAETDMMGVIHHAVYPVWAEAARTNLMNAMGVRYSDIETSGIMLPVTEIYFSYRAPVKFEDNVLIKSAVTNLDSRRLRIDYEIEVQNKLCVYGHSKHLYMNKETRKSMRIDAEILDNFRKYFHPEFQKNS
ncbi:MAG: acyl-CoA thioesterase [Brevinemataceae bacterium]